MNPLFKRREATKKKFKTQDKRKRIFKRRNKDKDARRTQQSIEKKVTIRSKSPKEVVEHSSGNERKDIRPSIGNIENKKAKPVGITPKVKTGI